MLEMVTNSARLFLAGKLFKDNRLAMRQLGAGILAGVVAGVIVGLVLPIWVAAMVSGAVAGFAQPVLFKNLKYA